MRIIIEIDDEAETTEVREQVGSSEQSRQEATDAGEAPQSRSPVAEETSGPGPAPAEHSHRPGRATDAGSAPESLPEPATQGETNVQATAGATDAGSAPGPGSAPSSSGGATGGGPPGGEPLTTPTEWTDAGPPPGAPQERSETDHGAAIDYEAIVSGTVDEVKDRVQGGDLDVSKVFEAERSGDSRNTLLDWLERQESS